MSYVRSLLFALAVPWAHLGLAQPSAATAEQETALGGCVRGPSGKPVIEASVSVHAATPDIVGQFVETEVDVVQTDKEGRWSTRRVKPEFKSLTFKLTHPEMLACEYYVLEKPAGSSNEVSRADLQAAKAVMRMLPKIAITGRALDAAGKPLPGASVFLRTDAEPIDYHATTDTNGSFKILLASPGRGLVAMAATGLAPDYVELDFEENPKPVELRLQKGKPLKGRVLRADGGPLAGTEVSLAWWNDLPFPDWRTYTDGEGRFTWDSAPLKGAFYRVNAARLGAIVPQSAEPGDSEVILWTVKYGLVAGKVIDAETRKPIPGFNIIPGRTLGTAVAWDDYRPQSFTNGQYRVESGDPSFVSSLRVRVEAKGYLPEISPPLAAKGVVNHDFQLKKGHGPTGTVRLADGSPARDAWVALITPGARLVLTNRELLTRSTNRPAFLVRTGRDGDFALPPVHSEQLVACSKDGYADVPLTSTSTNLEITLQPWATIRGVVRNGSLPATNELVAVTRRRTNLEADFEYDPGSYSTLTDSQGGFTLANVPPGERYINRLYTNSFRPCWSHPRLLKLAPGTNELLYGGLGRRVTGQFVWSTSPPRDVSWDAGFHTLSTSFFPRPQGPGGRKGAVPEFRHYGVKVRPDGSFIVEDVEPGKYSFHLSFVDRVLTDRALAAAFHEIEVPEISNEKPVEPLNLGTIKLEYQSPFMH